MGKVRLVDGGFSTQLAKHVGHIIDGDPLWSARFLATDKEKCVSAHRDFVRAGVDIITTASYQSSIGGYQTHLGLTEEEAIALMKESVVLARRAIELEEKASGEKKEVSVAGSVGPYGATLHDGSEYRGDYGDKMTKEELIEWHRPRVKALIDAGVDLLAFETIPCSAEALALVALLKQYPNSKAWLSFSIRDTGKISDGESFKEVAEKCWELGFNQLVAIGVNCLHPSLVIPVLQELLDSSPHIPLIAYPNSGETYDAVNGRWIQSDNDCFVTEYLKDWLNLGISYLGGCCRTSDKEINIFSKEIKMWESNKTIE